MELEDHEGFNNNHNYHPKPYNSPSNKKYHGERSPIFNLNVPLSEKNLTQFLNSFEKTKSFEAQFSFLNALLKASPQILEKFADSKGATLLSKILHESARDLNAKMEIIDRILIFFNKIELTTDILTRTRIHQEVENIKNTPGISDELSNKTFKMLIKWRPVIEQWQNEGGERRAQEYFEEYLRESRESRERSRARTFIKRTNTYHSDRSSNDSRSESRSSEENRHDYSRKNKDNRKGFKSSRRDGGYSRGSNKYYSRRSNGHKSPSIEEIRKSVQWNEDNSLVKVKYFRFNDEPSHRALTEDEVAQIQEKLSNDLKISPSSLSSEDIKHKESQMEGNSFKIKKDNEKEIQSKLNAMVESISWYRPRKIAILSEPIQYGINSYEAKEHDKRTATKLPCFYLKDSQIPDHPSFDFIKNQRKTTSTPLEIPLVTSNADGEPEESILNEIERFVRETGNPEGALGTTTTGEFRQFESSKNEMKIEKEPKKPEKTAQPVRSILKKSKEQLAKEREEARALEEEKQRELQKKKEGLSLDSDIVMKLMSEEISQEEKERIVNELKEKGDAEGLLQNIVTLRKFMTNVSHTGKPARKKDKYGGPPGGGPQGGEYFGQEPRKMVKFNPENPMGQGQNMSSRDMPNMQNTQGMPMQHSGSGMLIEQDKSPRGGFDPEYANRNRDYRGGQFDPSAVNMDVVNKKTSKTPFRPNNYKTVPCALFHSPRGCHFGESCNFIHDLNHPGRQTPNMHKYVRPLDQIKTGKEGEEFESSPTMGGVMPNQNPGFPPMVQNPNPNQSPRMNPNMGGGPPGNYYGKGGDRGGGMNIEPVQQNQPGMNPYMNPKSNPPHNYGRMNQPTGNMPPNTYMHQNPMGNKPMNYNNNRMGVNPHQGGNQMNYQNPQGHQQGYRGGHPSHQNRMGHTGHPMMNPPPESYRNDMMYPTGPQRMPPNMYSHPMPMQTGYNPGMMPPKMPPTGAGYGMMDPSKGKE